MLIGEIIKLSIECSGCSLSEFEWSIPGIIFKDYVATVDNATLTNLEPADFNKSSITFCWADSSESRTVSVKFKADGISCEKSTVFYVKKPTSAAQAVIGSPALLNGDTVKLRNEAHASKAGIEFGAQVAMPSKPQGLPPFPTGQWQFVQKLVIRPLAKPVNPASPLHNITTSFYNKRVCDQTYPYGSPPGEPTPPFPADGTAHHSNDSPEYGLLASSFTKLSTMEYDDYETYVMFQPSGGKWVPLKVIKWGWRFCVSFEGNPPAWVLYPPTEATYKKVEDTSIHPQWTAHIPNQIVLNVNLPKVVSYCGS